MAASRHTGAFRTGATVLALCVAAAVVGVVVSTRVALADPTPPGADLAWTKQAPSTVPTARAVYGMSLDRNGDVIMLGGDAGHASAIGDFWKYTEPGGVPTWTPLKPAHTPWGLVGASGLADAQMRLDPVSGNVIAFGGTAYQGNFNYTWSWNGTDWLLLHPAHVPSPRSEYGMDYDPSTGHIMVMGGWPAGQFGAMDGDTWVWSGTDWVQQSAAHSPGPRSGQIMVRDPSRGITVLFGGHNGSNGNPYAQVLDDTWTWNGSDWTQQHPLHVPAARDYAQAYYDPHLQMVVMCGGGSNTQAFSDCWGWAGSDWVKIDQDAVSDIGGGTTLVYSPTLAKTVTFGGWPSIGDWPDSETWTLATQAPATGPNPVQYSQATAVGGGVQSLGFNLAPVDAGDVLTAVVAVHKPAQSTASITPPSGWTALATGGSGSSPWVGVYTDTDPAPGTTSAAFTASIGSGSVIAGGVVTEYRGVPVAAESDSAVVSGTGATGQAATAVGVNAAGTDQLALAAFATDSTGAGTGLTTSATPPGWGLAGDQADGASGDGIAVWAYWQPGTGAVPSASLAWTDTGGNLPFTTAVAAVGAAVTAPPTISSVSPSSGSTAGGTAVTVTGTNLTGTSAVKFGTLAGANASVNATGTSLTVTSPPESAGTVDVTVTTPGGTSAITQPADQYTFATPPPPPMPTVVSVSPSSGSTAGDTAVTVTGTNLTGTSAVNFGSQAGANVSVNATGTSLTVTSPPESAGTVDVTVTTLGGTSAVTQPADQYTFVTPPPPPPTTISAVGSFSSRTGQITTLSVKPQRAGDVFAVFAQRWSGATLRSVTGGGVSTWTRALQFVGSVGADEEIWYGTITTPGSSTITFSWSTGRHTADYGAQEFTAGLGPSTVWSVDQTGTLNGALGTSVPFPALTPTGSGEVYFGYTVPNNFAVAGSTPGFGYAVSPEDNIAAFDTDVSATVSPMAAQSPASTSSSLAVLLTASP